MYLYNTEPDTDYEEEWKKEMGIIYAKEMEIRKLYSVPKPAWKFSRENWQGSLFSFRHLSTGWRCISGMKYEDIKMHLIT